MLQLISGMDWYVAKVIYRVVCGDGLHTPQFDEQLMLIKADEIQWAWEKAQVLGRRGECAFQNHAREQVQWKFINVVEVVKVESMEDGMLLYSHTEESECAEDYISFAHAKAERFCKMMDHKSNIRVS